MKRISILTLCLMQCIMSIAQEAPTQGWTSKALKSIVSVNTYDKENNLLHSGTGFYANNTGSVIADYDIFREAYSASIIDQSGKKYEVMRILGADDTYGLVKFSTTNNKSTPLQFATSRPAEGAKLMVLGYSQKKPATCPAASINGVETINDSIPYYSLDYPIDSKYQGCPVFNTSGEVVATLQQPITNKGYAVGIDLAKSLAISAITSKIDNYALNNIHIKKGLPESAEESLVYLYFKSRTAGNEEYLDLLNLFVETYPDNAEGYFRRATPLIDTFKFDEADNDLNKFYDLIDDKASANARIADIIHTKLVYQPTPEYDKWNFDVALSHIDKAIEADNQLKYRLSKGQILMSKKDYDGAFQLYDEINKSADRVPATLYAQSLASTGRGDSLSVQIELIDSAIAMFPTPMPTEAATYIMRRAQLYANAGRYREAVTDYNQYSFLNNSSLNHRFYYDRSQLELQARMYQQALDDLNTACSQAPNEPLYLIELSALHLRIGDTDECIKAAQKALQLNDQLADAYRIMGYAQITKGDKVNGKANLQKAIDLGDESAKQIMEDYVK